MGRKIVKKRDGSATVIATGKNNPRTGILGNIPKGKTSTLPKSKPEKNSKSVYTAEQRKLLTAMTKPPKSKGETAGKYLCPTPTVCKVKYHTSPAACTTFKQYVHANGMPETLKETLVHQAVENTQPGAWCELSYNYTRPIQTIDYDEQDTDDVEPETTYGSLIVDNPQVEKADMLELAETLIRNYSEETKPYRKAKDASDAKLQHPAYVNKLAGMLTEEETFTNPDSYYVNVVRGYYGEEIKGTEFAYPEIRQQLEQVFTDFLKSVQ